MIFFLAVLLMVGFIGTSFISYLFSRNSIRLSILNNELPLTSDNIYSEIQRDLLRPIFISSLMANDTFLKSWIVNGEKNLNEIRDYLSEIKKKYNTISAFLVSEKSRKYYYPGGILKEVQTDDPRDQWYFRVRDMKDLFEINVDPDMANKDTMTIFINYQIHDQNSNIIGATGVGLTVNMVKSLINTYSNRYNRNIYFFRKDGNLILHSISPDQPNPSISHISSIRGLEKFEEQLLKGNLRNFEYQHSGSNILLNVRYIQELNWYLVVEQKEDNTNLLLKKTLIVNISVCLVVSLIVLGIIRITIIRYQENLENRNLALEDKNQQIIAQQSQLEQQTKLLQQANNELKILNQEKDEIIGITAHDLKSPMNAIVGFSELISRNPANDQEIQEIADYILESSLKMVERINNLLDVGEAESGFELKLEPFDFRESISRTVQDFRFQAQNKNILIKTDFPDQPFMTMANEKWMVGIVGNLVSNAIKYSNPNNEIILELKKTENRIRLDVVDHGPGIPADELPKLFKKYSRVSTSTKAGTNSTGLGLYIVKKMTQRMGGNVWCESTVGKGSRFIVEFSAA